MSVKTRIEALEKRLAKPEPEETVVKVRIITSIAVRKSSNCERQGSWTRARRRQAGPTWPRPLGHRRSTWT